MAKSKKNEEKKKKEEKEKADQDKTGKEVGVSIIGAVIGAIIGAALCLSFKDEIILWVNKNTDNPNFEYLIYVVICIVNMIMPTIIGYCAGNDSSTFSNNAMLYFMIWCILFIIYRYFARPTFGFFVAFATIFFLFFILSIYSGIDDDGLFVWWWAFIIIIFSIILAVVYYYGYLKNILDTFMNNPDDAVAILNPFTRHFFDSVNKLFYSVSNYLNIILESIEEDSNTKENNKVIEGNNDKDIKDIEDPVVTN